LKIAAGQALDAAQLFAVFWLDSVRTRGTDIADFY
jgi:hypothetical protein